MSASFSSASKRIGSAAAPTSSPAAAVSFSSSGTVAAHPLRRQRGVVDEQSAARLYHGLGVEGLFAVADRQRHVGRRQPDGGHFGDGLRARPAEHHVGRGVREVHPVHVRYRDVRRQPGGVVAAVLALRADHVQDLDAARAKAGAPRHGLVEPAGALRAAGDQQRRQVGVEPEARAPLGAEPRRGRGWRSSGGSACRCSGRAAACCRGAGGDGVVNRAPTCWRGRAGRWPRGRRSAPPAGRQVAGTAT